MRSLDRSLFAREEIERRRQALEDLKIRPRQCRKQLCRKAEDLDSAVREEEEAEKEVERTPAAEREADEETIAALRKGRDQFASTVAELPALRKDRDREKERLKEAIREISADWGEQDVASFDCSMGAREKVQTFERMCADSREKSKKRKEGSEQRIRERQDACEMVDRKTREIEKTRPVPSPVRSWPPARASLRAFGPLRHS